MKNVLFITYDGLTDTLGQSQILPYLVGLSKKGHNIHILSTEKAEHYEKEKEIIQKICNKNDLTWHNITYTKKPPIVSTLKDLFKLEKEALKICKANNIDILHCRSYIPALIGLKLKKKIGVKFLFDMRGFWADERVDGGLWNLDSPAYKLVYNFFKKKERQFVTHADTIVSLTTAGKDVIQAWGIKNAPIEIIPCCADFNHFDFQKISSESIDKERKKFGITNDQLVLSYLGSIGTWYMLEEMLDFFVELKNKYPSAIFQFITREPAQPIIDLGIKKGLKENDFIISPATRENVPIRLAISNLSIFFIKPCYSKKASSPTKQAEIMGMGIPLICNTNVGDVDRIVQDTNSGVQVDSFTVEEYKKSIQKIPELLQLSPNDIREQGIKYFSLKDGIDKYDKIYQTL